jgi:hypothetical protein
VQHQTRAAVVVAVQQRPLVAAGVVTQCLPLRVRISISGETARRRLLDNCSGTQILGHRRATVETPRRSVSERFPDQFEVDPHRAGFTRVSVGQALGELAVRVPEPVVEYCEAPCRERRLFRFADIEHGQRPDGRAQRGIIAVGVGRGRRLTADHDGHRLDNDHNDNQHYGRRKHQQPTAPPLPRRSASPPLHDGHGGTSRPTSRLRRNARSTR